MTPKNILGSAGGFGGSFGSAISRNTVVPWYTKPEWEKLKALGAKDMDETFEAWQTDAQAAASKMIAQGIHITRMNVDANAFQHWCEGKSLDVKTASRTQYVQEKSFSEGLTKDSKGKTRLDKSVMNASAPPPLFKAAQKGTRGMR